MGPSMGLNRNTGKGIDLSVPDTNIEKQENRHKGPLSGMALAAIIAALGFVGVLAWLAWAGMEPREGLDVDAAAPAVGIAAE